MTQSSIPRSRPTESASEERARYRLAIVISHPIQYFSPWFAQIARTGGADLRVFYLWDFGVENRYDRDFGRSFRWDLPLLEGYESEFVPNASDDPGTHKFAGLDNPALIDRLAEWRPDAVLLFGYAYKTHLRLLLSPRLRHVPVILRGDSHDLGRSASWRSRAARIARRLIFRRCAAFLPVGSANAQYYRSSGVPDSKLHFAPHAVDNNRFGMEASAGLLAAADWKRELGIASGCAVVLFAGKFEPRKRPLDLIRAFRAAFHDRGSVALLLVGSGELEDELRKCAGDLIGRSIFFAPFQNQKRMPVVYAAGDVFVLPSESETWGLSVNEAMNLARPVIVSSHVGCGPDLVIEGETGWVFPAGDVDALAATLTTALSDRQRLSKMGEAARERVAAYSYSAATDGLMAAIRAVVPRKVRPGAGN